MYAVGIVNIGNRGCYVPCGNNGLQRLHNKTERGWRSECSVMLKVNDEVWIVNDFTQAMCEMNNGTLVEHVRKIGRRLLQ